MRACLATSVWRPAESVTAEARSVDVILGSREKDMTNLVNKQKHATIELFNLSREVFVRTVGNGTASAERTVRPSVCGLD